MYNRVDFQRSILLLAADTKEWVQRLVRAAELLEDSRVGCRWVAWDVRDEGYFATPLKVFGVFASFRAMQHEDEVHTGVEGVVLEP